MKELELEQPVFGANYIKGKMKAEPGGESWTWNEPRHEKTCLQGLRPGKTQTGLLSFRN